MRCSACAQAAGRDIPFELPASYPRCKLECRNFSRRNGIHVRYSNQPKTASTGAKPTFGCHAPPRASAAAMLATCMMHPPFRLVLNKHPPFRILLQPISYSCALFVPSATSRTFMPTPSSRKGACPLLCTSPPPSPPPVCKRWSSASPSSKIRA